MSKKEFREIAHSGGQVVIQIGDPQGRRGYQPTWIHQRPVASAIFAIFALAQGVPVCGLALGAWAVQYRHFRFRVVTWYSSARWTVIRVEDRNAHLSALDSASIDMNIGPFAAFSAERVRGSLERHDLTFPAPNENYNFDRQAVMFLGQDGNTRVSCAISREALDDLFGGDNYKDKLEVFKANRRTIEQEARRKYLDGRTERDGSVLIRTGDL